MTETFDDVVQVDSTGPKKIVLDAQNGKISITGVSRMPTPENPRLVGGKIELDAAKLEIVIRDGVIEEGGKILLKFINGQLQISSDVKIGSGSNQILFLRNDHDSETIRVYGHGVLAVGGEGNDGRIYLVDSNKNDNIIIDGKGNGQISMLDDRRQTNLFIHGNIRSPIGAQGNIEIFGESNDGRRYQSLYFNARHSFLRVGSETESGGILVQGPNGNEIDINGNTGDIRLSGGDCAEQFEMADKSATIPGTVVVIGDDGRMHACNKPHDKRVMGVVSGGQGTNPGVILGTGCKIDMCAPIALTGKVYCKVDAAFGAIDPGDLLTSSSTVGHAMKADSPADTFGTVIGKAMSTMVEGRGMIPILVTLN